MSERRHLRPYSGQEHTVFIFIQSDDDDDDDDVDDGDDDGKIKRYQTEKEGP